MVSSCNVSTPEAIVSIDKKNTPLMVAVKSVLVVDMLVSDFLATIFALAKPKALVRAPIMLSIVYDVY